jgi:hypothetical protein
MEHELLRDALHRAATDDDADKRRQHIRPLRGVRGVSDGAIARILAAAWTESKPTAADVPSLGSLFSGAFEDGLVAIGLLAALLPDDPVAVEVVGRQLLDRVDDVTTADALGWLVLGPAAATNRTFPGLLDGARDREHPSARRAIAASGLALLPEPLTGPCAAALRERLGVRQIRFVEAPVVEGVRAVLDTFLRDPAPEVQKAVHRLVRTFSVHAPDEAQTWVDTVRGGAPRTIREALVERKRGGRR